MPTSIREHRRAKKFNPDDRRCEVCQRGTDGISHLCRQHLTRRRVFGSVKAEQHLRYKDYAFLVGVAMKYLKANPPSSDIRESVLRFLQPPGMVSHYRRKGVRKRELLIIEMARWGDPRYRKKWWTRRGKTIRKADYSPRGILAVLIGVWAFIEEREGQGFPGESDQFEMMFALTRLWKRPRRMAGRTGAKQSHRVSGTVLRELVKRWRTFNTLTLYVLLTARAIVQELAAKRAASNAKAVADAKVAAPAQKVFIRWLAPRVETRPGPENERTLKLYREWQANERAYEESDVKAYVMLNEPPQPRSQIE